MDAAANISEYVTDIKLIKKADDGNLEDLDDFEKLVLEKMREDGNNIYDIRTRFTLEEVVYVLRPFTDKLKKEGQIIKIYDFIGDDDIPGNKPVYPRILFATPNEIAPVYSIEQYVKAPTTVQ